jgi:hypothetical protein
MQLGENQCSKHDPNLLDSAAKKVIQLIAVPLGQTNVEAMIGSHDLASNLLDPGSST